MERSPRAIGARFEESLASQAEGVSRPSRRAALVTLAGGLGAGWPALRAQAQEASRSALVLGNASYPMAPLANALNDARLVTRTLKDLGFRVRLLADTAFDDMLVAVKAWLNESAPAAVRMMYFAGHGAQYRGNNYLVPVDARLLSEDDLPGAALSVQELTDRLSRFESGVNVVVLDACRSAPGTPLPPGLRWRGPANSIPASSGLSAAVAPRGTLIAYATSPGAVAADNPRARNSVYTQHLVHHLATPGLPIEAVFKRTRAAVLAASGGSQVPWESSSLVSEFCFAPNAAGGCGLMPQPPLLATNGPRK
jgi:uncharacterized caspase-like protein